MKIAPSAYKKNDHPKKKPLLSLVPEDDVPLTRENSIQLELKTNPTEDASPKYKMSMRILEGSEDVRTILRWRRDLEQVTHGLNLTTAANMRVMYLKMMKGNPAAIFRARLDQLCDKEKKAAIKTAERAHEDQDHMNELNRREVLAFLNTDMIRYSLNLLLTQILPKKILERVKRYIRRECRKSSDTSIRAWVNHLHRMNNEEIANLPPFNPDQALREDEMIDIVLYGTPRSWQREMDRQGFDPMLSDLGQVVDFLERIEMSEEQNLDSKKPAAKSNGKHSPSKGDGGGNGKKFCLLHGHGNHTSDECHKLIAEAKRHKSDQYSSNKNHVNRTWQKKAAEGSASSKKELAAFVKKAVQKGVQKELAAIDTKKRKSDDDAELHAFDMDLKDFNYDDMENLTLSNGECSEAEA